MAVIRDVIKSADDDDHDDVHIETNICIIRLCSDYVSMLGQCLTRWPCVFWCLLVPDCPGIIWDNWTLPPFVSLSGRTALRAIVKSVV